MTDPRAARSGSQELPPESPALPVPRDSLTLKWGTWKAWDINSEAGKAALSRYLDAGPQSLGAMSQHETDEQREALCDLIDAINADTIGNDWSGEDMTKDEAKKYVREYRR